MAFNVKKNKRLPAEDSGQEDSTTATTTQSPFGQNVVATHGWVFGKLKKLWNWTKFFATESAQVAGGLNAGRITTNEVQTNDVYAKTLYLLDKNGRPMTIYVDDNGDIQKVYDFSNVFLFPSEGVDVRAFFYRHRSDPDPCAIPPDRLVAMNFIGLTPYELLMNFVPYVSQGTTSCEDKTCFKLCVADGDKELLRKTFLVTCQPTKRISRVYVFDRDGNVTDICSAPEGKNYRRMTVNMPSFKSHDAGSETVRIRLPGRFPASSGAFVPFIPPFLKPPKPPGFIPPVTPFGPNPPFPEFPDNDIFSAEVVVPQDEDLYQDIPEQDEQSVQP